MHRYFSSASAGVDAANSPIVPGQVRGLAISAAKRTTLAPEFPTMQEQGVADFEISSWYGLFMPGKTPPDIIHTVNADMVKMMAERAMKERLAPLGIEAASSMPQELAMAAKAETEPWGDVIQKSGIRSE